MKDSSWFQHTGDVTASDWYGILFAMAGAGGLTSWIPNMNFTKTTATK